MRFQRPNITVTSLFAVSIATLAVPGGASADGGGARVPGTPTLTAANCVAASGKPCAASPGFQSGGTIELAGSNLAATASVVFRGRQGEGDDRTARPTHRASSHVDTVIPADARSGPVAVVDKLGRASTELTLRIARGAPIDAAPTTSFFFDGRRKPTLQLSASEPSSATVTVLQQPDGIPVASWTAALNAGVNTVRWDGKIAGQPAAAGSYSLQASVTPTVTIAGDTAPFELRDHLFPIRGKHNLGYTRTNQFGGGRGHQGIDMFAKCGVPLAAARGGRVQFAGYHARSGNYVVIDGAGTDTDYAYMHMQSAPLVQTGQRVFTGQRLGETGDTGNADGCHLHFEMWAAPGWYEGGSPLDPLLELKRWGEYS